MILCAGKIERLPFATSVGVGMVQSAIEATQIALTKKPEYFLFVGSAGAYCKSYNIFDIVTSTSASNIELSFFQNNSFTPIDNVLVSNNKLLVNETIVNSSNYITQNFELSQKYLEHSIMIENMEFYSLVHVANRFQIPIAGMFVITNYTNDSAHQDFIKNHKYAMQTLENKLKNLKLIN